MTQTEAEVTAACRNWLISRGWRPHRNHCGVFFTERGVRITGEVPGTPDWTFHKPTQRGHAQLLYVEMKATAGKLSKAQREIHAILRHKGYTVLTVKSVDELADQVRSVYADGHISD